MMFVFIAVFFLFVGCCLFAAANVTSAKSLHCLLRHGTGHPSVAVARIAEVLTGVKNVGAKHAERRRESAAVLLTTLCAGVSCRD
jgi:hypothetical protein